MDNIFYIDNHIHGSFGINFNYADYEDMRFVLRELYKKNIRGICPTLVGESIKNIQRQLLLFQQIQKEQKEKLLDEAYIIGVHLEGTFLSPKKAGIQDKNTFLVPSVDNFKKLVGEYEDIIKIVNLKISYTFKGETEEFNVQKLKIKEM